ncbi:hypothetical protein CEY17_07115 [Corynebacterium glutamicum ATCC 14067]|nr:hypothetical protein A3654_07035 [Corynebacterium glutamicum]AST20561.1 hypothetical protein CEY17_07115 [Corynebacterium glutamicum ATCC 14067]KIH73940.1 hypothetical protein SD36_07060 [Corynebacterium glutamicum]OKX94116.1 hypothetical protein AUP71_07760 [Corynebacterium glutamicum]
MKNYFYLLFTSDPLIAHSGLGVWRHFWMIPGKFWAAAAGFQEVSMRVAWDIG